jgi:hypothetical protein
MLLVGLVCGALLVGAVAGPASAVSAATNAPPATTNVRGLYGDAKVDGTCPPNEPELGGIQEHQQLVALAHTRFGPGLLKLDFCQVFEGALGGRRLTGTFSLITFVGTLRGHVDRGLIGFGAMDHITASLVVDRGTFLLTRIRGSLEFETRLPRDTRVFDGTLTTSLHRV